jgi:cytochrome c peroxidase
MKTIISSFGLLLLVATACHDSNSEEEIVVDNPISLEESDNDSTTTRSLADVFGSNIDLDNLANYADQEVPNYINEDNTASNVITDAGATLGRVLFYDKNLSSSNTIACASCHQQAQAFSDLAQASEGVNGSTGRHSMRLINSRFSDEEKFFWDERAISLEAQTTMPIQDHNEMGFSGANGDPSLNDLIAKLDTIDYYQTLFTYVYGDSKVTETRIQNSLAKFIRSIQSFDSKYDVGLSAARNDHARFTNFSDLENDGKDLFMDNVVLNNNGVRIDGGAGCNQCHRAPAFAIDPRTDGNGVIASINGGMDTEVTRSPTLRDMFNADGTLNGGLMHTGDMDFTDVLVHYNDIDNNANADRRLTERGIGQKLNLTDTEVAALTAFVKTLSGTQVYTDARWSDPFLN